MRAAAIALLGMIAIATLGACTQILGIEEIGSPIAAAGSVDGGAQDAADGGAE